MLSSVRDSKCKTNHPLHQIWNLMHYRCKSPKYYKFHRYGGRGIKVCPKWENFDDFIIDMYPSYFEGATLDRSDNDGDYSPDNCEWLTRAENSKKDMSKGINQYTLRGEYINSFQAMSDANISLGLKKEHGGLNRAVVQKKPFKGFRWARKSDILNLTQEDMVGKLNNMGISINQLDKDTLELIKVWSNAKEIVSTLSINGGSLSRVCNGKLNSTGGFKWAFASNPNL